VARGASRAFPGLRHRQGPGALLEVGPRTSIVAVRLRRMNPSFGGQGSSSPAGEAGLPAGGGSRRSRHSSFQHLPHPRVFQRPALHRPVLQDWYRVSEAFPLRAFQRPSRLGLSRRKVSPLKRARAVCVLPHLTSPEGLAYGRQDKRVETRF